MSQWSVVIPTYNRAHLLSATLASLPPASPESLEVIVVDDGSADDTAGVVARCGRPVRFLQQAQRGPGAARNLGWDHAQGRYVLFLDSDDLWFPWTLTALGEALSRHPGARFLIGSARPFRDEAELAGERPAPVQTDGYADYFASAATFIWIGASALAVRRECRARFEETRMNAEDIDLALHLGAEPGFVHVRQPFTFAYRQHGASLVGSTELTTKGALHLLSEEKEGRYEGGPPRARLRRELITRVVRPPALADAAAGAWPQAWALYAHSFAYHVALGRWRFLFGFWLHGLRAWASARRRPPRR